MEKYWLFRFWLVIASKPIVVLPILRSPIISSRCPRPKGINESTTRKPVYKGSTTPSRGIIPGARTSASRLTSILLPFTSDKNLEAIPFKVDPNTDGPTITFNALLLRTTRYPGFILTDLPKKANTKKSRSKEQTTPWLSEPNNNSPKKAVDAPLIRALPS